MHGNFMGSTVAYVGVSESSSTDAPPLYGTPVVSGDTLEFFPSPAVGPNPSIGFGAAAPPSDTTDGFLSFAVNAKPGFVLADIDISEGGDYSLSGLGSALAQVSANLIVQEIAITHVDGAALGTPVTSSSLNSVVVNFPPGPSPGIWNLGTSFDFDAMLTGASVPFTGGATRVTIKLNNTLQALAQPAAAASIVKKDFDVNVDSRAVVPEPASFALAMLGLSMVLASRKR
jgi:hypothetical protein